jgi:hypothetical protein
MTTNEERQYIISTLMRLPVRAFNGTLDDLTQLQELYALRIGPDDDWLEKMYGAHVQVIGECFTCFSKDKPMRLIKLDEKSIRIICDPCRENLHSAKSN